MGGRGPRFAHTNFPWLSLFSLFSFLFLKRDAPNCHYPCLLFKLSSWRCLSAPSFPPLHPHPRTSSSAADPPLVRVRRRRDVEGKPRPRCSHWSRSGFFLPAVPVRVRKAGRLSRGTDLALEPKDDSFCFSLLLLLRACLSGLCCALLLTFLVLGCRKSW